jgi:hypothetical protein
VKDQLPAALVGLDELTIDPLCSAFPLLSSRR